MELRKEERASENPAFYLWAREEEQMRKSSSMRCQLAFSRRKSVAGDTTNTMLIRDGMLRILPSVGDFWMCGSADGSSQQWQATGTQVTSGAGDPHSPLSFHTSNNPAAEEYWSAGILIEGGCTSSREPHPLSVDNGRGKEGGWQQITDSGFLSPCIHKRESTMKIGENTQV